MSAELAIPKTGNPAEWTDSERALVDAAQQDEEEK